MRKSILFVLGNLAFVMIVGTVIYHYLENWSWVDSFYFVGSHITTVGTSLVEPSRDITKILAVFIDFVGIIIGFYSLSILAILYFKNSSLSIWKLFSFGIHEEHKPKKDK